MLTCPLNYFENLGFKFTLAIRDINNTRSEAVQQESRLYDSYKELAYVS